MTLDNPTLEESDGQGTMLPLSLLNAAVAKPMLVELKNGETYNGHLVDCDNFMNITLRDVYLTSPEGDRFWKLKEIYLRGNVIKYLRVADTLLDKVQEDQQRFREQNKGQGGRGGGVGRGGGGGRGAPGGRGRGGGMMNGGRGGGPGGGGGGGGGRGGPRGRGRGQ